MKSKRIDSTKSLKKDLNKIQKNVRSLALDMKAIMDEHNSYKIDGGAEGVSKWIDSLPIETLSESLNTEHSLPRSKISIKDFKTKQDLRKKYLLKENEYTVLVHKKNEKHIEYVLDMIDKALK